MIAVLPGRVCLTAFRSVPGLPPPPREPLSLFMEFLLDHALIQAEDRADMAYDRTLREEQEVLSRLFLVLVHGFVLKGIHEHLAEQSCASLRIHLIAVE